MRLMRWGCILLIVGFHTGLNSPSKGGDIAPSVEIINNPAESLNGQRVIELTERWRIAEDSVDPMVGLITDVCRDSSGNICLLDYHLKTILVYGAAGNLIKTVGREGDGPGEFRRPYNIHSWPGAYLAVTFTTPPQFHLFHENGDPGPVISLEENASDSISGNPSIQLSQLAGNLIGAEILYRNYETDVINSTRRICSLNRDGMIEDVYFQAQTSTHLRQQITRSEDDLVRLESRWALFDDARICYVTGHMGYKIHLCESDGHESMIIQRDYESLRRSDIEKRRASRRFEKIERFYPNISYKVSDWHKDIESIHARKDGSLWVQNSRGRWDLPEGTFAVYDVFDKQGRFVEQIILNAPGDPSNDVIYILGDDVVIVYDFWDRAYRTGGTITPESDQAASDSVDAMLICFSMQ